MFLAALALFAATLTPAQFAKRPGWFVGAGHVRSCPGSCKMVGSWAGTVRWRDCLNCIPPHKTLAVLPANGIAISLLLAPEKQLPKAVLRWPPRLRASEATNFEGAPTRIGVIQRAGRLHGLSAQLYIFFGRPHPTARQLARAQAELATARLP